MVDELNECADLRRFEFDEIAVEIERFRILADADTDDGAVLFGPILRVDFVVAVGVHVGRKHDLPTASPGVVFLGGEIASEREQRFFAVDFPRVNVRKREQHWWRKRFQ